MSMIGNFVTIWVPTALIFTIAGMLLSCFCLRKRGRIKLQSSSQKPNEATTEKFHQLPTEESSKDRPNEPHPFLPLSLYSSAATSAYAVVGRTDTHPDTLALMDCSYLVSNTCIGAAPNTVSHLLIRQESNSHRNCELPPVPTGPDYHEPSDNPPITLDCLTSSHPTEEQRHSGIGSVQGPYYSSVVSVGSPAEYGDIADMVPPRSQTIQTTNPTIQTHRCDVYARVKPRSERHSNQVWAYPNLNMPVPIRSVTVPDATCKIGSVERSMTTADAGELLIMGGGDRLFEPPVPERGYGETEIEIVNQNRLLSSSSSVSNRSGHTGEMREGRAGSLIDFHYFLSDVQCQAGQLRPVVRLPLPLFQFFVYAVKNNRVCLIGFDISETGRSVGSPDGNVPLIRRLLNAIQLINARHYHDPDLLRTGANGEHSRPSSPSGGYRKITVEYERVYGVAGESNSSTTYEMVPGARDSIGGPTEFQSSSPSHANRSEQIVESHSKRFSEIYSEIPYTTCYALPFTTPAGTSSSTTAPVGGEMSFSDVELPVASSTLNRPDESPAPPSYISDLGASSLVCRSEHVKPNKTIISPQTDNNTIGTTSVLAEMQRFRHMDSEEHCSDQDRIPMSISRTPGHAGCQSIATSLDGTIAIVPSMLATSDSFNPNLMPPLMERSIEDASLLGPSHPTTPSLGSSALSSPLNEAPVINSFDSDHLMQSTVPVSFGPSMNSVSLSPLGSCSFCPELLGSSGTFVGPVDRIPVDPIREQASSGLDAVTYDEVAS
ncbi:hypothetical protein FGIG_07859 [Fasciola gigantica]|uniref:Uncharacterized protein n=1 Tax=Fasciola gigantica TaxID=46835 RepID=A0A504Z7M3_FASGI|nr:hypothetical protein FGIG_07859 [Fasciola gigantica]